MRCSQSLGGSNFVLAPGGVTEESLPPPCSGGGGRQYAYRTVIRLGWFRYCMPMRPLKNVNIINSACAFGLLLLASIIAWHGPSYSQSVLETRASVEIGISGDMALPGAAVPLHFMGVSFDTGQMIKGTFTPSNTGLISILRDLNSHGSLRIGGTDCNQIPAPRRTLAMINDLHAFLSELGSGWKTNLIYCLNYSSDIEDIKREVGFVEATFGAGTAIYQIGNEPNGYFQSHADYQAVWNSIYAAIHGAYPAARFGGPDVTGPLSPWLTQFLAETKGKVALATEHFYTGPPKKFRTAAGLMASASYQMGTAPRGVAFIDAKRAAPLPIRMTETNTVQGGGQQGLSDAAIAANWVILISASLAQNGWEGLNVHGSCAGNWYSPYNCSGAVWWTTPIFSGMKLSSRIAGSRILPIRLSGTRPSSYVRAFSGLTGDGTIQFLIGNASASEALSINFEQEGNWKEAFVELAGEGGTSDKRSSLALPRGTPLNLPPGTGALVTLK
jgi:hypothetical protein